MDESNYIEFQKTRDFSNKLNATFEFVKQNFKSFGRCVLYFIGPPALIVGLLMGSLMGDYMNFIFGTMRGEGFDSANLPNLIMKVVMVVVGITITSVITIATVNGYVMLYREKQSGQIDTEEVWTYIKKTFWLYFWSMIGVVFVFILGYLLMLVPIILLGEISGFLLGLGIFALIIAIIWFVFASSLIFIVRGFEQKGFFECFSRSMYLIKGKWWSTFGLLMVLTLIVSITSSLVAIPWSFTNMASSLHKITEGGEGETGTDWFGIISNTLKYLLQYLLGVLPQIGLIFQYFNLVEMKESRGLMEKMETMGVQDQNTTTQKEDY